MSKKEFKPASPLSMFISSKPADTDNKHTDNTYTDNTHKKETKSRRINLLLFPSVAEAIEKIATMRQTSSNNLINEILREYAENHRDEIERYNAAFGGGEED